MAHGKLIADDGPIRRGRRIAHGGWIAHVSLRRDSSWLGKVGDSEPVGRGSEWLCEI